MTSTQNRAKQSTTLRERLETFARLNREKAATLPEGPERSALLKKAEQADTTAAAEYVA